MSEHYPDVAVVRRQARRDWDRAMRSRMSLQERIGESVPWWLIAIAAVFFLLSVPHTMAVFNKITPGVGYAAPFGVEFGLLYAAFRRRQMRRVSGQLIVLELLLFITAIVVNGAGSLEAVIALTQDIQGKSFEVLISEYRDLPVGSQVALVLVPIAALIIPIGTTVAGEGLAALFLERRETGNALDTQWQAERLRVEFEALRDAALSAGITPGRAVRWAEQITYAGAASKTVHVSMRPRVDVRTESERPVDESSEQAGRYGQVGNPSSGYTKQMDARSVIRAYLAQHPDMRDASLNQIVDNIQQEMGVKVGRSSVHNVLHEPVAFSSNGHRYGTD